MARKRAKKWNDLHLRPRVESITDDNVESNCSMIENIPPKGVSFSDLICIFAMSIVEFSCLFCNTKISEFFDMTKSWAARLCSLACSSNRLCRLPKQELLVAQVLKKFNL